MNAATKQVIQIIMTRVFYILFAKVGKKPIQPKQKQKRVVKNLNFFIYYYLLFTEDFS